MAFGVHAVAPDELLDEELLDELELVPPVPEELLEEELVDEELLDELELVPPVPDELLEEVLPPVPTPL